MCCNLVGTTAATHLYPAALDSSHSGVVMTRPHTTWLSVCLVVLVISQADAKKLFQFPWPKLTKPIKSFGWHAPQKPLSSLVQKRLDEKTGTVFTSSCCGLAGAARRSNVFREYMDKARAGAQSERVAASNGEFPWVAALVLTNQNSPLCGGAVINDRYVMTSAFCGSLATTTTTQLLVGEYDFQTVSGNEMRKTVSQVKIHPQFNTFFDQYNLALIQFTTPLTISTSTTIKPVCLPSGGYFILLGLLTATGWGTSLQGSSSFAILQKNFILVPPINLYCEWFIPPLINIAVRSANYCGFRSLFVIVARNQTTSTTELNGNAAEGKEHLISNATWSLTTNQTQDLIQNWQPSVNETTLPIQSWQASVNQTTLPSKNRQPSVNLTKQEIEGKSEAEERNDTSHQPSIGSTKIGPQTRIANCNGDLGSALLSFIGNKYEATGIVIGGWACNLLTPGRYFHPGFAYSWIISSTSDATYC